MVTTIWESPKVFCIQVELPQNPLRSLNVYVIATPEQNLLIDTGFNRPECRAALWDGIRELGLDLTRTSVFLTHLHSDHIGLAWDFVERGCPIYMGQIDHQYLSGIQERENLSAMEELFHREGFSWEELALQNEGNPGRKYGVTRMFPVTPVDDGTMLALGELSIRCIHTPGHTPGHMALHLPQEQLLFSGDHILFDITPNISVWHGVPHSLADYLDSLEKIRGLSIQATFPAHRHGDRDVYQRIDALKEHHRARLEEICQAVEAHPGATAYQVAGFITWSAQGLGWERFPPHQKWFAVGETLAHLRYLEREGRVSRAEGHGLFHYEVI